MRVRGDSGVGMFGRGAVGELTSDDLFGRVGAFLRQHGLSPDPAHYAFAWRALSDPDGPVGRAVAALTDGGVRLTRRDIEQLGGRVVPNEPGESVAERAVAPMLVARTHEQMQGFATLVKSVQDDTRGFGQDLAASAEAIRRSGRAMDIEDIVQITGVMLQRVRATERRLEDATRETDELRAKLEEAQGSARRDPLTELANRRALEEAFAAAGNAPLCLGVCDVDRFKQVNDRFGHGVGDRVLKAIGRALAETCEGHLVARYGGEEFAVLFTGIDAAEARRLMDAAREAVEAKRFRLRESDQPLGAITFSAGVGAIGAGERFETAFARVDRALYRAKAEGRNRVLPAGKPRG